MSALWFYHLERSALADALAPLLEKCLQRGWRAAVRGGLQDRLELLDQALWAWKEDSFLPHGLEGRDPPERQPILLMSGLTSGLTSGLSTSGLLAPGAGAPNGAKALFLIDGAEPGDIAGFERASIMFDGRDEAALVHARLQWKAAKDAGADVSYWKETAAGRWEKQA